MRLFSASAFLVFLFSLTQPAFGGTPFVVDPQKTGVAASWPDGVVIWYADKGTLPGYADNAEAVAMVEAQFEKWEKATLTGVDYEKFQSAKISNKQLYFSEGVDDITVKNYYDNCYKKSLKRTCIIFDEDGSIVEDLVGSDGNPELILGLTLPYAGGTTITHGFLVLNGLLLKNETVTKEQFEAAVLHELGHLIGLDHTQINLDVANTESCSISNDCEGYGQYIATMYPELVTKRQGDLSIDDIVTASFISPNVESPSQKFHPAFATITGEVFDKDGCFLKGVNVIAMRADEGETAERIDVRSMVSGVMTPGYIGDGRYYLYGLKPGAKYRVLAEPLFYGFFDKNGLSSIPPISNPPQNFKTTVIKTRDGEEFVTGLEAGKTFEMASLTLDVTNPCVEANACPEDCTPGSGDSSSGVSAKKICNMIPGGLFDAASAMGPLAVILSVGVIALRRKRT